MKHKILLSLVAVLLTALSAQAYDFQSGDLYYNITIGTTVEVTYQNSWSSTNYQGLTTAIIPATVTYNGTTYSVASIGDFAFEGCSSLTYVTIPNSVTSIGWGAFLDCSGLTSITIPNSVTSIGGSAFNNCSGLTSITIPNSVTSIEEWAFYNCSGLTSITIPNSVTTIGNGAFYNCSGLTSVTIGNSVTSIGSNAFSDCVQLTSITCEANTPPSCGISSYNNSFYNIPANCTIKVPCDSLEAYNTAPWYNYQLTNIPPPSLQVQPSNESLGSTTIDQEVDCDSTAIVSATANYGYHFVQWSDSVTENPRTIKLTKDTLLTAEFARNSYRILTTYEGAGKVEGDSTALYEDSVTLTAVPDYGWKFSGWEDGNMDNPRSIVLTQDTTLTAVFAQSFAGQCGDSLYWNFGDNELNITGTGAMYDYTKTTMPWMLFRDSIYLIRIGDSATYIGEYAFAGCPNLGTLFVGESVDTIAENTLANCQNLHVVYCYPTIPPYAENNSFTNYNGYLYVPCDSKRDYTLDAVWGNFKYIVCLGTEDATVTNDSVTVVADNATATFTWPATDDAETYSIVITKDGEVFCTLIFNTQGQLMTIAFAPSKDGSHHAPAAQLTANGYQFTVIGLESETHYAFTLDAKDEDGNVVAHYAGTFDTYNETAVENVPTESNVRKIYRDGNVYIIRDGEEYSILGQKL